MAGEYKAPCGCKIHVIQWTAKRKVVTQKSCSLHKAAPDLLEALKAAQFGFNHCRCALCGGWNMGPNGETDLVHTKDCIIARAINKAEGKQ